jgi:NADH-quinone oxidoreductase subunit E
MPSATIELDAAQREQLDAAQREQLDVVIARYRGMPGALLSVLERVQEGHEAKYLPRSALSYVAASLGLPLSQVRSVATFYAFFNLEPQGRHTVAVCRGTACHTRGSKNLMDLLRETLDFPANGEAEKAATTTRDGGVTLRTVACIGQCALAPVVEVDRSIYGRMNEPRLKRVLAELGQEGSR